jgi:hypothetical protein
MSRSISVALLYLATAVAPAAAQAFASEAFLARTTPQPVARAALALTSVNPTRQGRAPASAVVLRDFSLKPSGILFGMHPTEARIIVIAEAAAPLKVCEFGTTFSMYWKGGCRRLDRGRTALPTSGGAVHIGFRVLPSNGRTTRVASLQVRWHCVDHYFALLHGRTVVGRASPIFDC